MKKWTLIILIVGLTLHQRSDGADGRRRRRRRCGYVIDGAEYVLSIFLPSIHGTVWFWAAMKRDCVLHTYALMTGALIGKQASKRCIVASWISMDIRRWVIRRFFNIMLLKGTVLYDFMAFIRFPRGRLRVWTKAIG